jgi:hypothetical protein
MTNPELLRAKIMIDEIIKNKAFREAEEKYNFILSLFDQSTGEYDGDIIITSNEQWNQYIQMRNQGKIYKDSIELPRFCKYLKIVKGDFSIWGSRLTSLKGLENLQYVSGRFDCRNNKLTSLDELKNLQYVGGDFLGMAMANQNIFTKYYIQSIVKNIKGDIL